MLIANVIASSTVCVSEGCNEGIDPVLPLIVIEEVSLAIQRGFSS